MHNVYYIQIQVYSYCLQCHKSRKRNPETPQVQHVLLYIITGVLSTSSSVSTSQQVMCSNTRHKSNEHTCLSGSCFLFTGNFIVIVQYCASQVACVWHQLHLLCPVHYYTLSLSGRMPIFHLSAPGYRIYKYRCLSLVHNI